MKAVGLHPDVFVVTSRFWQTTCTLVKSGSEAFCVDSPVLPDELELLPAIASQSGFEVVGCVVTHADWDHLLGRYAFADAPLGMAESSAARLRSEPGAAARELRDFDEEHYVERPAPLRLPASQALPVPGHCSLGDDELELHPADGHTVDGMALWIPWASVLVCGDYLSPVEIPWISEGGSVSAYLATLNRLEEVVERAEHVVPGHGEVLDASRALAVLREDRAYLSALVERGSDASLPLARRNGAMRKIHRENVARVTG
ncbi:MAG: MBL fold metallo-hydrolase [Solirubrobacterales bacterium]|nr:MBL fold metallo-hydrolase [Solirubrobacterales bacterium]